LVISTYPLSLTCSEAEAFAFCTNKAVVDDVVPDPTMCNFAAGVVVLIPTFVPEKYVVLTKAEPEFTNRATPFVVNVVV
jgi:hypothetical protein